MSQEYTGSTASTTGLVDGLDDATGTAPGSNGLLNQASDKASQVADQVKDKVAPLVDQAQQKTGAIAGQVQEQATSRLEQQKQHAAEGLGSVAESLRQSGQQLRDNDQGIVTQYMAQYGEAAANQVEQVSTYLRDRDVSQIVHEVESFARREPAIFVGGAFLLGLIGARFLKSSAPTTPTTGASNFGSGAMPALPAPDSQLAAYSPPSHGIVTGNFSGPNGLSDETDLDDADVPSIGFDTGSSAV